MDRRAGDRLEKQTILIVDDTPESIAIVISSLEGQYRVKVAISGEKGLQIAFSNDPPDLILLDVMMPGMDGYEVCSHLKKEPQTADIPIIFLTSKDEIEEEMRGLELGAVDYLIKPVSPPILLARVQTHLKIKKVSDYLKDKLEQAYLLLKS